MNGEYTITVRQVLEACQIAHQNRTYPMNFSHPLTVLEELTGCPEELCQLAMKFAVEAGLVNYVAVNWQPWLTWLGTEALEKRAK